MANLPHHRQATDAQQRKEELTLVTVDVIVFVLILAATAFGFGYWRGYESQTPVIRIPERVTPSCIEKGALKKVLFDYSKQLNPRRIK